MNRKRTPGGQTGLGCGPGWARGKHEKALRAERTAGRSGEGAGGNLEVTCEEEEEDRASSRVTASTRTTRLHWEGRQRTTGVPEEREKGAEPAQRNNRWARPKPGDGTGRPGLRCERDS